jgi:hypothetical protein
MIGGLTATAPSPLFADRRRRNMKQSWQKFLDYFLIGVLGILPIVPRGIRVGTMVDHS